MTEIKIPQSLANDAKDTAEDALKSQYSKSLKDIGIDDMEDIDEALDDPKKSFMDDVLVIPVNMAGLPGMSIPIGKNSDQLPIGMHIIGASFDEATIYQLASYIEEEYHNGI